MTEIPEFPSERERLDLMHAVFDPITLRQLDVVGPLTGMRVMDAGAGRGRITKALWERIGPGGSLLAADLKLEHLEDHGTVAYERRVVDLSRLDNVPEEFDLVFSRLVLDHVNERDKAVELLSGRLAHLGILFLQDLDMSPAMAYDDDVPQDYAGTVRAYHQWCVDHGYEYLWVRTLPGLLDRCGLTDVCVQEQVVWFRRGSAYARMFAATLAVHRKEMSPWIDPAEVTRIYHWLQEGSDWLPGSSVWTVWGRRSA